MTGDYKLFNTHDMNNPNLTLRTYISLSLIEF